MATIQSLAAAAADKDNFGTEDWLVPVITAVASLLSALLGVVVGQKIGRTTQLELEEARGRREDDREKRSERSALAAEIRIVIATCRVYLDEREDARRVVANSAEHARWWPESQHVGPRLPLDDRRLLAKHFREHAWEIVALGEHALNGLRAERADEEAYHAFPATGTDFHLPIEGIDNAMRVIRSERDYLQQALANLT